MLVMFLVFILIIGVFIKMKVFEKLGKISVIVLIFLFGIIVIVVLIGIGLMMLFGF